MSHPKNRRDRFIIGNKKARKRVSMWFNCQLWQREGEARRVEALEAQFVRHRDTTKRCGRACCTNPRHNGYKDRLTMQEKKFEESLKLTC